MADARMTDSDPETMLAIVLITIALIPLIVAGVWAYSVLT